MYGILLVNGTCMDRYVLMGQSQPLIRDVGTGNLLVASAILFCGLTFTGIYNLAKSSESTFLSTFKFLAVKILS